jgi:hypothetical protein
MGSLVPGDEKAELQEMRWIKTMQQQLVLSPAILDFLDRL